MDIVYSSRKLERTFNSEARLTQTYGVRMARTIMVRMAVLSAAPNLSFVPHLPPERLHQLKGNRDEQFTVDLTHNYRLVFIPNHDPVPRKEDGGVNLERITAIIIDKVEDPHTKKTRRRT